MDNKSSNHNKCFCQNTLTKRTGTFGSCRYCFKPQTRDNYYRCNAGNQCKYKQITTRNFAICIDYKNYFDNISNDNLSDMIIKQINYLS